MTDQKEALLERIVDYVLEHGVTQLTLRGLAAAVDSNNRMLLYYFGSREELIVAALAGAETRFPSMTQVISTIDDDTRPLDARLLASWQTISDPANLPFHRLFFEIFGLAGFERQRYTAFLGEVGSQWIEHVAAAFSHSGVEAERATRFGHEVVALWRGFQATLLTGGDPAIIDLAAREATLALADRAAHVSPALQNPPRY